MAVKKILVTRQEILEYTGLSKRLYLRFIRAGMPVLYIEGRCYAHTENIDEFFKTITRSNAKNLPDDEIIGEEIPDTGNGNRNAP